FQAADGIRDGHVTGVQTCALPIFDTTEGAATMPPPRRALQRRSPPRPSADLAVVDAVVVDVVASGLREPAAHHVRGAHDRHVERSEERRVGTEWRTRWGPWSRRHR